MPALVQIDPEKLLSDINQRPTRNIPEYDATWTPINVMYVMLIHCGMRHTDFLLQRAVVQRAKLDSRQLVPSARNLLQLTLHFIAKKDYFSDFQVDMVNMVG